MFGNRSSACINCSYSGLFGSALSVRIKIIVNTVNVVTVVTAVNVVKAV